MKYMDDISTERITNLKSLLDNFKEAKKYLKEWQEIFKKNKQNQQLYRKNANLFEKNKKRKIKRVRLMTNKLSFRTIRNGAVSGIFGK